MLVRVFLQALMHHSSYVRKFCWVLAQSWRQLCEHSQIMCRTVSHKERYSSALKDTVSTMVVCRDE